jgi:hypothetical protein
LTCICAEVRIGPFKNSELTKVEMKSVGQLRFENMKNNVLAALHMQHTAEFIQQET